MDTRHNVCTSKDAFVAFVQQHLPLIETSIRERLPKPYAHLEDEGVEGFLYEPLREFVFSGGKRIRPALCLLGAQAVGAPVQVALSPAYAVELFQAAALIHDDIADKSELRRSVPCMHISQGTGIAINVGDVAIVDVVAEVMHDETLSLDTRMRLFDELYAMERITLEGQALDLGWVRDARWDITEDDYLAMAVLKTAHYSCGIPLAMGAICGAGSQEQVEGLRSFGIACGLAFQIQDDLLNLVGDEKSQGKDYRSDITEGKRTLVMVHALRNLDDDGAQELGHILSSHATNKNDLDRAVTLANQAGAIAYADTYAKQLIRDAKATLEQVDCTPEVRSTLLSMADFFVTRTH